MGMQTLSVQRKSAVGDDREPPELKNLYWYKSM
jgi:hypothetical protein